MSSPWIVFLASYSFLASGVHVRRDAFPDAFPISHEHELKIPKILGPLWLSLAPVLDVELPKYKIRDLDLLRYLQVKWQ